MELLNPDEIKSQSSVNEEQAHVRTQKLASEENRLAREINKARDDAKEEINKIDADLVIYKQEKKKEKAKVSQEVEALRNEKMDLLKPIDKILENAEGILKSSNDRAEEVDKYKETVDAISEQNQENAEDNKDREQYLNECDEKLNTREEGIKKQEGAVKVSSQSILTKWTEYYKAVILLDDRRNKIDKDIETVRVTEEAIAGRRVSQNKREEDLYIRERRLISNYEALEKAKKHLGIEL